MKGGRGLSQREGILTLSLDYASEQRDAPSVARKHDCQRGTEMSNRLKK
jgi:hypothetical protein